MPTLRSNAGRGLRRLLLWLAETLVALYVIVNAVAVPVFRPVLRGLARLHVALRLEALFAHLPPYVILVLLLVPFLTAEPAKAFALYLIGTGHFTAGAILFVGAYFVSLVLVDQIYRGGKSKLRTLPWFAKLMDWLVALRNLFLGWAQSTRIWRTAQRIRAEIRATMSRWRLRWTNWLASLRT